MRNLRRHRSAALVAAGLLGASALAGCTNPITGAAAPSVSHGRLTVLALGPVDTWDPQRISAPQDIAFAGRTFLRTLTAFPSGGDGASQRNVVGDLATDAGTPDATFTTWRFTLRKGITWQDGSPITCAPA